MATRFHPSAHFLPLALVLVCAVVLAIASVPFASAGDPIAPLSPKDRMDVFETVWKDIRDTYYDPEFHGVNWSEVHDRYRPQLDQVQSDDGLYSLLNRMAGELHDAHTRVSSPEQWENRQKQQGLNIGFFVHELEGKIVVADVHPDSGAAKAGVEPGMIVQTFEGKPIADRIAEIANRVAGTSTERITRLRIINSAFGGAANAPVKVGFERADGSTFEVSLTRQVLPYPPDVHSRTLPSGDAYIRFDGFQSNVDKEFKEALAGFRSAPGLIVDLRWNGGGRGDVLLAIAGYFYDKTTVFAKYMTRKEVAVSESSEPDKAHRKETKAGKDGEQLYAGPVVILTDTRSGSSSELLAGGLQETGRAKVVGGQTCGCAIGIAQNHKLKGGGVLEVSQVLWFTPGGRKIEGGGVIPDQTVVPAIADLQQKRDVVLDAAEKLLHPAGAHFN